MTPDLEAKVKAALELASRATPGPWKADDFCSERVTRVGLPDKAGWPDATIAHAMTNIDRDGAELADTGISPTKAEGNAALIATSHSRIELIKDLHAALLASEEARVKAEVDARRWRIVEDNPGYLKVIRLGHKTRQRFAFVSPFTNYEYDTYKTASEAVDAAMQVTP